jgi:hypothetical protein
MTNGNIHVQLIVVNNYISMTIYITEIKIINISIILLQNYKYLKTIYLLIVSNCKRS